MPFEFDGYQIRTLIDEKGEPWFVAKDVCKVVKITKYRDAVVKLDDDERMSMIVDTLGGKQKMVCVNEFGLYTLILMSQKPQAKQVRRWVTHEVLPSIRKTGQYALPQQPLRNKVEQIDFAKFIEDCLIPDPSNLEKSRDIYLVYQSWCLQNKYPARTIQWVGTQLRKQGYKKGKCPPKGVACWYGFRLNNLACPVNPTTLEDLQSYLSALSKNLAVGVQYSNAELLSLVNTAAQKAMAIQ